MSGIRKRRLWWVDIETTGLDPRTDWICEIALATSDFDRPFDITVLQESLILPVPSHLMHQDIRDIHDQSGLSRLCRQACEAWKEMEGGAYCAALKDVENEVLESILNYKKYSHDDFYECDHYLAGNSVHFERLFFRYHMPKLYPLISYRLFDMSAVYLFCQSMGMPRTEPPKAHRALPDIRASVKLGSLCAEWIRTSVSESVASDRRALFGLAFKGNPLQDDER